MKMRRHRSSLARAAVFFSGAICQLAFSQNAAAQDDLATETGAARTLAVDGLKLAQNGKCDEAVPKLERAEKVHHSAIVLSRLGECNVSLGKLVEGSEQLRRVLREPLPANPSPALSKAYERAQTSLDSARPKIAGLTISVTKPFPTDMRLTVDGLSVPVTLVDTELPADPGDHLVEATASGFLKSAARVNLGTADKKTVALKLEVDPNAPVVAPSTGESPAASVPPTPASDRSPSENVSSSTPPASRAAPNHAAAYAAWSMGVVGAGVGTAFGVIAMKDKHDLVSRCGSNQCGSESQQSLDSAKRSGNISTVAFAIGGVGVLLGTVLYFTVGSDSHEASAAAKPRTFAGLTHERALIGPSSLQLAADF